MHYAWLQPWLSGGSWEIQQGGRHPMLHSGVLVWFQAVCDCLSQLAVVDALIACAAQQVTH